MRRREPQEKVLPTVQVGEDVAESGGRQGMGET